MNERPRERAERRREADGDRTETDGDPSAAASSQSLPPTVVQVPDKRPDSPTGTMDYDTDALTTDSAHGRTSERSIDASLPSAGVAIGGYDILGSLGRGAMGVVYKARQRALKRLVALKMISAGAHASDRERTRFRAEAEAAARLTHPNIVQVHEVGEHEGRPFFSLEFVDGGSLARKIDGTPQPPGYAAEIVRVLAGAMEYAHQHSVIHRDLKPANILLAADGTPKIADFGLAKSLEDESVHTQTGTIMGTPSYMSPEQAGGVTHEIGPPADVYALGAILYDLLTGRPPFRGTSLWETVDQVKTQEPVPPRQLQPGVPLDLETICLKCLEKDPSRRYTSAAGLAEDLRRFLASEPIFARPLSSPERAWRWCRRNPWLAGLSSAAVLLVAAWAITSTFLYFVIRAEKEETERHRQIATKNETVAIEKEGLARQREEEANQQRKRAEKHADAIREQFVHNITRVHALMERLTTRLQPKAGQAVSPETAALRKEFLELTRATMVDMSRDFGKAGVSPFGILLVCQRMGDLMRRLGLADEARQQYQLGVDAGRLVVKAQPNNDRARGNLGFMLGKLGESVLDSSGEVTRAAEYFREALETNAGVLTNLLAKPAGAQDKKTIAETWGNQLRYHRQLSECAELMWDPADVRRCLMTALAFWSERNQAEPKDARATSYLAQTNSLLGDACSWCGDTQSSEKHHQAAVRLCEALLKDSPGHAGFLADLALVSLGYGDMLLRRGQPGKAEKLYRQSLERAEAADRKDPGAVWIQFSLAQCFERLGSLLLLDGKEPEAAEPFARSLKQWQDVASKRPGNLPYQVGLCAALARCGKYPAARQQAESLLQRARNRPEVIIGAARCFALSANDPTTQKGPLLARTMELLRQAARQGFRNARALKAERDWRVIAENPGFVQFVAQLTVANTSGSARK
jgi:serine/threonine-protein kinase